MAVGLVAQRGNRSAEQVALEVREALHAAGVTVRLDEATGEALGIGGEPVAALDDCVLVASIGGDGTFLFTASAVDDTPIVGVNLGEVGFLNAVAPADASRVIRDAYGRAVAGNLAYQELPRVVARFDDDRVGPALNEIIVHAPQRGRPGRVTAVICVDGERYHRDRVDGVMVATPTGSTAYNLSEDGPLMTPAIPALAVNPMCGADPMPPLVVPLDATITIDLGGADLAYVISDGRRRQRATVPVSVTIERAATPVRIAGPPLEFFEALGKLG